MPHQIWISFIGYYFTHCWSWSTVCFFLNNGTAYGSTQYLRNPTSVRITSIIFFEKHWKCIFRKNEKIPTLMYRFHISDLSHFGSDVIIIIILITTRNTIRRINQWLIGEAIIEATEKRDSFNLLQFENMNIKNMSQSDRDHLNLYLFGEV